MAFNFATAFDPEMEQLFRDFYQSLSEQDRPKAFAHLGFCCLWAWVQF